MTTRSGLDLVLAAIAGATLALWLTRGKVPPPSTRLAQRADDSDDSGSSRAGVVDQGLRNDVADMVPDGLAPVV